MDEVHLVRKAVGGEQQGLGVQHGLTRLGRRMLEVGQQHDAARRGHVVGQVAAVQVQPPAPVGVVAADGLALAGAQVTQQAL